MRTKEMLKFRMAGRVTTAALAFMGVSVATPLSYAYFCRVLDNTVVQIGESKASFASAGSNYYANAYFDSGDQISIPEGRIIGKLTNQTVTFDALLGSYTEDIWNVAGECGEFSHSYELFYDASPPSSCGGSVTSLGTATWTIDTCDLQPQGTYQGLVGFGHFALGDPVRHFKTDIRVKKDGVNQNTDSGCFGVETNSGCTTH